MSKYIVKDSIKCLSNAKLNDTTYEIARDIVIEQLNEYKEVLDKIKEEVEYWGYDRNTNDDSAFRMAMKKIHHLLEEIE